jgi:paraquat-inducible protein A
MTIACADCGATQSIPPVRRGETAECRRCHRVLHRRGTTVEVPLACAAAAFVLLPPAVFLPLMDSTIRNLVFEESRLVSSVPVIYSEVWFPFAFGFLFFAFLFPALRALFQVLVLGSIRFGFRIWQQGRIFRWSEELRIWSMTDVVVIAGLVAYYRASVPADVDVRVGAFCYIGVAVLAILADWTIDRRAVWYSIYPDLPQHPGRDLPSCDVCELAVKRRRAGDPCPRCGAMIARPVEFRFIPALAAIAAAAPLLIPSYGAAVMVNDQLTAVLEHTVVGTVQLLADRGYWQFAVIVMLTGIAIPIVTVAVMMWLLATVRFPSRRGLVIRTRAYRLVVRLVRWPMVLPFIAALAAPIVNFRGLDDIISGPGATPLFMLIALLIFAVRLFEPKLMWRTAGVTT